MEIARITLARALWIFDIAELNPSGARVGELVEQLLIPYEFQEKPTPEETSQRRGKFRGGKFEWMGRELEVALEIHKDGLIAESSFATEAADAFLEQILAGFSNALKVRYPPRMTRKRAHRSEMVVYVDAGLSGFCSKLDEFAKTLTDATSHTHELTALVFGSENRQTAFSFERRVGEPFEENKFFTSALMHTSDHITVLEKLETQIKQTYSIGEDQP